LGCDRASLVNPGYHDKATLRRDLTAARLQRIKVDRIMLPAVASSARAAAVATVHGSLIRTVIESQYPVRLDAATDAVEATLRAKFGPEAVALRPPRPKRPHRAPNRDSRRSALVRARRRGHRRR